MQPDTTFAANIGSMMYEVKIEEENCDAESAGDMKLDLKRENLSEWRITGDSSRNKKLLKRGVCRCCLSRGKFESMEVISVSAEHTQSYVQILEETLGIALTQARSVRLICASCASRLVDAYALRKQVLSAEETFIAQNKLEEEYPKPEPVLEIQAEQSIKKFEETTRIDLPPVKLDPDLYETPELDLISRNNTPSPLPAERSSKSKKSKRAYVKKKTSELLKCDFCKRRCDTQEMKDEHIQEKHLTCKTCKKVFNNVHDRMEHARLHKIQCNLCEEIFPNPELKRRHYMSKHGIKCTICQVRVLPQCKYKHNIEFHGAQPVECGICNRNFSNKYRLIVHQRKVHMKEKNVSCPDCDFVAFDESAMNRHKLKHGTDKFYQCEYCHKKFVRRSTLQYHVRIHTGDKRAVCKICGEAFVQRASLKYHLEKYHPGDCY